LFAPQEDDPTMNDLTTPTGLLQGQIALVTGASSGLGRRFAVTLAAHGAHVAATARRVDRLEELVGEIVSAGGTALAVGLDVTDATQISDAVERVSRELGPISILVNNAGIPDANYATKLPLELVDQVLATNVRAPFLLSREVASRMIKEKRPGRIVNISSMGAFSYGGQGAALYSVSKAAVNRMTEALAVEWAAFGINVNAIAPGAFRSEMMDGMVERIGDVSARFPRKRMGEPERLDSTLLYLVSPESEYVTGTVIKVDDGQQSR
jgi:NAD(P)-dependent dehydrogenase (short-subunit alcohol dehydrogenase family)